MGFVYYGILVVKKRWMVRDFPWQGTVELHNLTHMSTANHFTQASRYAAQLDPAAFLRWLLGPVADRYRFQRWLDLGPLTPAGASPRCGALVAELVERTVMAFPWVLAVELQTEPDPDLFGKLLEHLGRLWQQARPTEQPERRFQLAALVVNLTGASRTGRVMPFGEGFRLALDTREANLATLEAPALLEAIAQEKLPATLLPWVPLLKGGGEAALVERWKELAQQEPENPRRGDYAALALVFADRAEVRPAWQQALEEWDVTESVQVLAWQEQARRQGVAEGRAACLLELLENRFKKVPAAVTTKIKDTEDATLLEEWFRAALTAATLAEFRKQLKEKEG